MQPFINWVASYPRSGNTWVRALLLAYRQGDLFDINRMEAIPGEPNDPVYRLIWPGKDSYDAGDWVHMRATALLYAYETSRHKPFVLKTHTANIKVHDVPLIPKNYTNKALYIYRDPREVLCSCAKYFDKTHEQMLELMLNEKHALTDDKSGVIQFLSSYKMHVKGWLQEKTFPVMGVKYSDLVKDPGGMLISILKFFDPDIRIDMDRAKFAVDVTGLKRLRKTEKKKGFREKPPGVKKFFGTGGEHWSEVLDSEIEERLMQAVFSKVDSSPKLKAKAGYKIERAE